MKRGGENLIWLAKKFKNAFLDSAFNFHLNGTVSCLDRLEIMLYSEQIFVEETPVLRYYRICQFIQLISLLFFFM